MPYPSLADIRRAIPRDAAPSRGLTRAVLEGLRAFPLPGVERAVARTGAERAEDSLNAREFGAVGDGRTDDTQALKAAFAAAAGKALRLPAGTYRVAETLLTADATRVVGDGMGVTVLARDPSYAGGDAGPLIADDGERRRSAFTAEDMTIRGAGEALAAAGRSGGEGERHVSLGNTERVALLRVEGVDSGRMSFAVQNAAEVTVAFCRVLMSARDGFNFVNCASVTAIHNRVRHCCDDSIALHSSAVERGDGVPEGPHVVAFNAIEDGFGIKALGLRTGVVLGNTVVRGRSYGIFVGESEKQGRHSVSDIVIADNVIRDLIYNFNDPEGGGPANRLCHAIWFRALPARRGDAAAVPGEPDEGGDFVAPEAYATLMAEPEGERDNGSPVLPSGRVVISGNVAAWTAATEEIARAGVWLPGGFIEPDLSDGHVMKPRSKGVYLEGPLEKTIVGRNVIEGAERGVDLTDDGNIVRRHVTLEGNILTRIKAAGLFSDLPSALITSRGNSFDLDPYFEAAAAARDGTWRAGKGEAPAAFWVRGTRAVLSDGDLFRRANRVVFAEAGGVVDLRLPTYVAGAVTGEGIGDRPEAFGQRVVVEEARADEPGFGTIIGVA